MIEKYLTSFVGWAHHHLEANNLFRFTATLLKYCAPMIYNKMNHSCVFNQIFQHMILTPDVMVGKQPTIDFSKNMVLSFPNLCTTLAKMNYKQDSGLMDKFNNLIIKWTPLISKADGVMGFVIKAYSDVIKICEPDVIEATMVIFANFFIDPKHCKAMTSKYSFMGAAVSRAIYEQAVKLNEMKLEAVLSGTLEAILEHVAYFDEASTSKSIYLDILIDILSSSRMNSFGCIK